MNDWLESMTYCAVIVISLTHHTLLGQRAIHLCAQRAPHSNASTFKAELYIQKGPSHIWWCTTLFQFYSCCADWLCGGGSGDFMELRVVEDWGPWKSDSVKQLLTGKVIGTETNKEWRYWQIEGSCTGLNRKKDQKGQHMEKRTGR